MDDDLSPLTSEPLTADRGGRLAAEWRATIEPFERQVQEANAHAVALGAMGLRALFILNGGALLVFPAYLSVLGTDLDAAFRPTVLAGASFLGGLMLAAIATLLAYLSEAYRARSLFQARQAVAGAFEAVHRGDVDVAIAADMGTYRARTLRTAKITPGLRVAAIVIAAISLAFFAAGAVCSAAAVMTGPGSSDDTGVSTV